MASYTNKSNLWKIAIALCSAVLCVAILVGAFTFADFSSNAEEPTYVVTGVSLKDGAEVCDDYDENTIKEILVVTAYEKDNESNVISDLVGAHYTVQINSDGTLSTSDVNTLSVTGDGGGDAVTLTINAEDVVAVTPELALVPVDTTMSFDGEFWRNNDTISSYAFTQGMEGDVASMLKAVAVYPHKGNVDITDAKITLTNGTGDNVSDKHTAIFSVTSASFADLNGNCEVNFKQLKPYALAIVDEGWTAPSDLLSSTRISTTANIQSAFNFNDHTVGVKYTDGKVKQGTNDVAVRSLSVVGSLTPSAEYFEQLAQGAAAPTYVTTIGFKGNGVGTDGVDYSELLPVYVTVSVKFDDNIQSVTIIDNRNELTADEIKQYARQEFNFAGFYFNFRYNAVSSFQTPISDELKGYITGFTFYNESLTPTGKNFLTVDAAYVNFNYEVPVGNGTTIEGSSEDYFTIDVLRGYMALPEIETFEPEFKEGGVDIALSLASIEELEVRKLIGVTINNGAVLTNDEEYNYNISFAKGGDYALTMMLASDGDFEWAPASGKYIEHSEYVLTYKIVVSGAAVTLTLENYDTSRKYGDKEPAYQIQGVVGEGSAMNFTLSALGNVPGIFDTPSYKLKYVGTSKDKNDVETPYDSYDCPTARGSYTVYAETADTDYYKASESNKVKFTIDEYILDFDNMVQSITFDAQNHSFTEFVQLNNSSALPYGEAIENVLDIPERDDDYYFHAKEYNETLTISNKNYAWDEKGTLTQDVNIEITKETLSFSVDDRTFVYGGSLGSETVRDGNLKGWATVSDTVTFFEADDSWNKVGSALTASSNAWSAGKYIAVYTTKDLATPVGTAGQDYDLPEFSAHITVTRRPITALTISGDNGTYNGGDHTFTINDWNADGISMGILAADIASGSAIDISKVLEIAVDGKLLTDGTTTITTNITNNYDGVIKVREAGTYTFSITIKNSNYMWTGEDGTSTSAVVTHSAAIDRAEYTIMWQESNDKPVTAWTESIAYTYDNVAHYPTLSVKEADAVNSLAIQYAFYSDADCKNEISPSDIVAAATYYVKVSGITGANIDGAQYTYAVNYTAPDTLVQSFVIANKGLAKPQLDRLKSEVLNDDDVSVVYNGETVVFTKYIKDYDTAYKLGDIEMLSVKYLVNGLETAPKNVLNDGNSAYTVSIMPSGNFEWEDGSETAATFNLYITQKAIGLTWSGNVEYDGDGKLPTAAATGLHSSDSGKVTVTVAYDDGTTSKEDAGSYTVKATALTGSSAGNYKLPSTVTNTFAIYKKAIAKPEQPEFTKEFNGVQTATFGNAAFSGGIVSAAVTGKYPAEFCITENGGAFGAGVLAQCSFDVTTGVFTFTNAGTYTVTFTISNSNYCWQGDGKEYDFDNSDYGYSWTDFATVTRKEIVSPAFGENRAMEWTGEIADLKALIEASLSGYSFSYTVQFGNRDALGAMKDNQAEIDRDSENKAVRGQYFVLLTIDGEDKYNYVWKDVAYDNGEGDGYAGSTFITGGKVFELLRTAQDGAQIKLYYAITASQVNIELTVNNYMFGSNGAYIGAIENTNRLGYLSETVIKITNPLDGEATFNGGEAGGSITYTFTDEDGNELTEGNGLVNGLPWNVGKYKLQVVIIFDKKLNAETGRYEEVYSKWDSGERELEVTARPLEVEWSFDSPYTGNASTVEYNGERRLPVAVVTNMPGQNDPATELPTLTYNYDSSNAPINAQSGAYTIKVTGGFGNNFSLEGTADFALTITKCTVEIKAEAGQRHVYGNTFDVSALWTTANGTSFFNNDGDNIKAVLLLNGAGNALTSANTAAGTYMLCPVWGNNVVISWSSKDDGTYAISTTNYNISVTAAEYTIEKRQVTVTFDADGALSVYGQEVNLYQESTIYTLSSSNGTGNVLVDGDNINDVFTLAAWLGENKVTEADSKKWAAKTYRVLGTEVDGNYVVEFVGEGKYVITNAEIRDLVVNGYNEEYDGSSHLMFGTPTAETVNNQTLTWYYQDINASNKDEWTEYTAQSLIKNVLESGKYYIKVEAPNHNDAFLMDGTDRKVVEVAVSKKTVTVQIDITIKYGEMSPADKSYLMSKEDLAKANYTFVGLYEDVSAVTNLQINGKLYSTPDYAQGANALGDYGIVLENGALTADNYIFVNADEDGTTKGKLTVEQLALKVTLSKVETTYYETYGNALFAGSVSIALPKSTYNADRDVELTSELYSFITSDADGFTGANIIELTTTAYVNGVAQGVTANGYVISGKLKAEAVNFTAEFTGDLGENKATHIIKPASLTPNEVTDYDGIYDGQEHGIIGNGWAEAVDNAALTVEFYVSDNKVSASELDWDELETLIDNPTFVNASTYYVYYRVTADNHNPLYGMGTVEIAKRAIVIQAENVTLTYGEDAPAFYKYTAQAVSGNIDSGLVGGDTLESIFAKYIQDGKLPAYFISSYAAGRDYGYGGDHDILYNEIAEYELENYVIDDIKGATLHVNKLNVTISISDAKNHYNLSLLDNVTGAYSEEKRAKLEWKYADNGNKFLDSDYDESDSLLVFELFTEAWTSHNGKLTNKVAEGGYPIYAKWLSYGDGSKSFADNYTIEFTDCGYTGSLPDEAVKGSANSAGIYTIMPAEVFVEWTGPFDNEEGTIAATNDKIYSGKAKYYKATVQIDEGGDNVKFDLTYYDRNTNKKLDSAPVNYGFYRVTATTKDPNYVAGYSALPFEILRAKLIVGWKLDNSVAGTIQYGEKITDFDETTHSYPASANGRFSGLQFVFDSKYYDIDAIASSELTKTLGIKSYGYTTIYNPANSTVGNITISTNIVLEEDSNFEIDTQSSQTLVVAARKINVWVKGLNDGNALATSAYTGADPLTNGAWKNKIDQWLQAKESDAFVNSQGLTDLDVVLSLAANKYDVAIYGVIPTQGNNKNANYAVTFVDGTGREIGSDNRPTYEITKAELKVNTLGVSVVYGNALPEVMLDGILNSDVSANFLNTYVKFTGWQNGEGYLGIYNNDAQMSENKFVFDVDYTPYQTNVGNSIVINLDETNSLLKFTNYTVVYDSTNNEKLNVTRRPITASTTDREYEEALDGNNLPVYNQGKYGAALEAQITFGNHNGGVGYTSDYLPVFTRTYNTKAAEGQIASKAPTMVGDYNVTVTLNSNSNYTFVKNGKHVDNVTLSYSIFQQTIAPEWKYSAIKNDHADGETESGLQNSLIGYVQSIMEIGRFEKTNGLTVLIPQIPEGTGVDAYQIGTAANGEKVGLTITATGRGEYRITLELTAAAQKNYKFDGASAVSKTIIFTVSSEVVIINNLHIDDWTYLDSAKQATFDVIGGNKGDVVFTYAKVTGEVPSTPDNAWYQSLVYTATPYEVSSYVLRAVHPSTVNADGETVGGAVEYCVFRITPRTVVAPTITTTDLVYTGGRLQAVIEFNPVELRIANYAGLMYEIVDGNTVLYATNADEYVITFDLVDSKNYQWGSVTSLTWEISAATGSTITWNAHDDIKYGETFAPDATATYGGNVIYYYMVKDASAENAPEWNDTNWSTSLKGNVGFYWVKAERAATTNYDVAHAIVSFEIKKATLTVTPFGSMIYGNTFDPTSSSFRFEITDGLVNFDSKEVIKFVDGAQVSYCVVDAPEKLTAANYGFVLNSQNGYVVGLTADNYDIVSGTGTFTVTPRPVTITLGNASSQYGTAINLEGVSASFSDATAEQEIELNLYATANTTSDCGIYKISANYSNGNYSITLVDGVYTVTQRQVTVRIDSVDDVEYGSTVNNPIKYSVLDGNGEDITAFVNSHNFKLRVSYSGKTNGGATYPESETMPVLAGTYTATVRGSGNANFIVVGEPFTSFVVSKKEVDGSYIKIASQYYTGRELTPVINADEFETLYGKNIYKVGSLSGFVNAGSHSVTLTLNDFNNYKWKSVEINSRDITFVINQAVNKAIVDLTINGWTYGEYSAENNMPAITVQFGQANVQFVYSSNENGEYKAGAPEAGDVGEYYVKAIVAETSNYRAFESKPVKFAISKKALAKPTLTIVSEGESKNDVYTGSDLLSVIVGFNMALMNLNYEGKFNVNAGQVVVIAVNAGTYTVKLSIADTHNYRWQGVDGNEVELTWTIAPKAVAKPTANNSMFMVNGQVLTYVPQGFDEDIMSIDGNQTAYGGEFTVTVGLKDKANYVWEDGTTDDLTFDWNVIGANTVFVIVVSVLGGACGVALLAAGFQLIMDRRRKRIADRDIDARSQAEEDKTNQGGNE